MLMVRPADVVQLAVFVGLSIVPAYSCLLPSRPKSEAPSIVLRHGILEIFIRLPSNLAQIKVVSFLTLNRNLFESTLEKNSARYPANDNNPDKSLHVFFQRRPRFAMRQTDDREMPFSLSISYGLFR